MACGQVKGCSEAKLSTYIAWKVDRAYAFPNRFKSIVTDKKSVRRYFGSIATFCFVKLAEITVQQVWSRVTCWPLLALKELSRPRNPLPRVPRTQKSAKNVPKANLEFVVQTL
eukprot:1499168-Amphidinium_carterae.1